MGASGQGAHTSHQTKKLTHDDLRHFRERFGLPLSDDDLGHARQLAFYREDVQGQILEEGISEAGALASWIAAGTAWSHSGQPMLPCYIFVRRGAAARGWPESGLCRQRLHPRLSGPDRPAADAAVMSVVGSAGRGRRRRALSGSPGAVAGRLPAGRAVGNAVAIASRAGKCRAPGSLSAFPHTGRLL